MTSISKLTEEEGNFTRFFLLNFKVSPDIARRFFDGVFPPTNLAQSINSRMHAIIKLKNQKRINQAQLELLMAIPGTVWPNYLPPLPVGTTAISSKDFDLTLIICLLRNIGGLFAPSNGWDQLPHPSDTLPGAHLATMKWYRNKLAHTAVTSMDKHEFTDKWNRVEKALTSLNNGQRPHEVSDLLSLDLDGELAKRANAELNHLKKEYLECEKEKEQIESDFSFYREGHLPKNIAEANAAIVDAWRIEDESFYETKGTEFVYDKVKESDCMLVTSNSGLGKTATIRHIALKLHSEGFEIVPVESPEDIIKYKTNRKQVFLIDDVLGKYDLSLTLLEKWERINEKLICYLKTEMGSKKILCTLRLQVESHKRFKNASTILNQVVINLEHESTVLSKEEKRKMLLKHLNRNNTENEIKAEEIEIMCDSKYAFPLLCKLVSNNEERFRKRIAFFRQPLSLLNEELIKISIENKKLYCTLVLCMLYNGTLSRSMFYIDSHQCDEKIYTIIQTCGLQRNMSKKELEESALSAIGSYFTKDSYNIRFIHDALAETVGCHFSTFNPKVMFSECHILFIRDRVRVGICSDENENDNEDENIVIIQEDELNENHFRPLFNRLFNELKSGRFSSLLMSHLFKNRNFVRIFGITIDNNRSMFVSIHTLLTKVSSERVQRDQSIFEKTVEFLSSYRDQSVVGKKVEEICSSNKEFQDNNDAISRVIEAVWSRSTLMYWIIAFGCYEFFKYAWSKITSIERKWFLGRDIIQQPTFKSFFPLAVLGGSIDIVTQLISSGADVNCFSEFWETPLYIAVKSGRYDMVSLLVSKGAKVNLRGWFAMKIPVSVTANKHELTSLMLESDLNQTELHIAVRQNDLTKLRSSIRSENIDSKTESGWTVLHYAVILNNIAAVKALLHEVLHQNDDHCFYSTQDDQGDLICRKPTPKVNIVDNNGLTALHLAVINNNIEIVALLLRKKAKVKKTDHFDRTPLHYTKSDRATKLLLIHCSGTNQSAEEESGYIKPAMSALRTVLSNITLQTALRVVCRDCVNMPDKEGDTPLHSVIKRRLSKEECSDCIETLLRNGANPYLCNESGFSAYELIDSSSETAKYINYSATYKQSLEKTHAVFALVLFTFIALTIGLPVWFSVMISKESQNAVYCVGQVAESGNITLVPLTKSIYVILLTFSLFWSLSLTFKITYSVFLRRIFIIVALIGCGGFVLFGALVYIQFIYKFMYMAVFVAILFILMSQGMSHSNTVLFIHRPSWTGLFGIGILPSICIFSMFFLVFVTDTSVIENLRKSLYYIDFYTIRDMNTLNITTLNCTEFSLENIICSSLSSNNITYKNGVDFKIQCHTDPNITSYRGTLALESEFIDWSKMGFIALFCLNFCLHAILSYCFLHCIFIFVQKIFRRIFKKPVLFLNGVAICSNINVSFFIAGYVYFLMNK